MQEARSGCDGRRRAPQLHNQCRDATGIHPLRTRARTRARERRHRGCKQQTPEQRAPTRRSELVILQDGTLLAGRGRNDAWPHDDALPEKHPSPRVFDLLVHLPNWVPRQPLRDIYVTAQLVVDKLPTTTLPAQPVVPVDGCPPVRLESIWGPERGPTHCAGRGWRHAIGPRCCVSEVVQRARGSHVLRQQVKRSRFEFQELNSFRKNGFSEHTDNALGLAQSMCLIVGARSAGMGN